MKAQSDSCNVDAARLITLSRPLLPQETPSVVQLINSASIPREKGSAQMTSKGNAISVHPMMDFLFKVPRPLKSRNVVTQIILLSSSTDTYFIKILTEIDPRGQRHQQSDQRIGPMQSVKPLAPKDPSELGTDQSTDSAPRCRKAVLSVLMQKQSAEII